MEAFKARSESGNSWPTVRPGLPLDLHAPPDSENLSNFHARLRLVPRSIYFIGKICKYSNITRFICISNRLISIPEVINRIAIWIYEDLSYHDDDGDDDDDDNDNPPGESGHNHHRGKCTEHCTGRKWYKRHGDDGKQWRGAIIFHTLCGVIVI
ncbi:hypothetical protein HZH66_012431 [Vespula vulgaris]|uniref:Uncharacterized protein n=1 Tax=Vespula vulgaris TaxID=7454 RepID=A0A834JEJ1_VESVU|nr:hypothetical protein HZH66_012431 [Vespula vulgaris]